WVRRSADRPGVSATSPAPGGVAAHRPKLLRRLLSAYLVQRGPEKLAGVAIRPPGPGRGRRSGVPTVREPVRLRRFPTSRAGSPSDLRGKRSGYGYVDGADRARIDGSRSGPDARSAAIVRDHRLPALVTAGGWSHGMNDEEDSDDGESTDLAGRRALRRHP